ncbi:Hypothetical predicted protein, partial [Pelobates cultripes]
NCLTNTLLPHCQTKNITFDGFFRIKKPKKAPTAASQDVIVQCQSLADKNQIMAAVRGKTTFTFESSQLSYHDLTSRTLSWQRSLGPVTHHLREAGIDYRWETPRTLTVNKAGSSLDEADPFLQALGIAPQPRQPTTSSAAPQWDPERIRPFVPRGRVDRGDLT